MMRDLSFRNPNPGYAWSKDYTKLIESMIDGAVVAMVLYDTFQDGRKLFDVCMMKRKPISDKHVELVASVRGIEYFSAYNAGEFVELCEKYEVKFMDPQSGNATRLALAKAVALYGQPGGPWNVPGEPGTWLHMAKKALGVEE